MKFTYFIPKSVLKKFSRFFPKDQKLILQTLEQIIQANHPLLDTRVKKMQGIPTRYRIKVSYNLRIVFVIDNHTLVISEINTRENIRY
jgi:mRNA-degrading endonuclease RelE of RelBE toxin-antitoxin system